MQEFTDNGPLPEGWGLWVDFLGIGAAKVVSITITSELEGRLIVSKIQKSITPSSATPVNWFIPLGGHTIKSILLSQDATLVTRGMLYAHVYISNGFLISSNKLRLLCQGAVLPYCPLAFPFDNRFKNFDDASCHYLMTGSGGAGSDYANTWQGAGYVSPRFGSCQVSTDATAGDRNAYIQIWNQSGTKCWEYLSAVNIPASTTATVMFSRTLCNPLPTGYDVSLLLSDTPVTYNGQVIIALYGLKAGDQISSVNLFCDWFPC